MKLQIAVAKDGEKIALNSEMLTRHGFITGATGTGKTVTLKLLAERVSELGASVFLIDVKGDLNSFGKSGELSERYQQYLDKHQLEAPEFKTYPTCYWDIFGQKGLPVRTTVTDLGPILMAKLLKLNDNQSNLLHTIFKIADEEGLLLLDYKDLTQMLKHLYENNKAYEEAYGVLNKQSLGAIQRALIALDNMEVDLFLGEKAFEIDDLLKEEGRINILEANQLILNEMLYATFLLWMLSELYEVLPEVGEVEVPKLVLFFDEAHLIFKGISKVLLGKIEQVIKLVRSKGVGIFFITQRPSDIPEEVLAQLGTKIQHGIRAKDAKNPMPGYERLMRFGVGEVAISYLDESGIASDYIDAVVMSPSSAIGMDLACDYYPDDELKQKYEKVIDQESAYELLTQRHTNYSAENRETKSERPQTRSTSRTNTSRTSTPKKKPGRKADSLGTKLAKALFTSMGRSMGSTLARGFMGTVKRF